MPYGDINFLVSLFSCIRHCPKQLKGLRFSNREWTGSNRICFVSHSSCIPCRNPLTIHNISGWKPTCLTLTFSFRPARRAYLKSKNVTKKNQITKNITPSWKNTSQEKLLGNLSMVPISFCTFAMVLLSFFDYQWYPRVIERLTAVIFSNFSVQNHLKSLTFFFFFYFFNVSNWKIKEKEKKLIGFGLKKLEKVTVVKTLNNTWLPLIIEKTLKYHW